MDLEVSKPSCNGLLLQYRCVFLSYEQCLVLSALRRTRFCTCSGNLMRTGLGATHFLDFFGIDVNALARDDSVSPEELLAVLQQLSDPADSRGTSFVEIQSQNSFGLRVRVS